MTQEEKDEYIKYAKLLIPKLQAELENAKQDAAQSDVDSIRALHERNELRVENETLVKRLADIAAVNVALEFRVIDLEKEIVELRADNVRLNKHADELYFEARNAEMFG